MKLGQHRFLPLMSMMTVLWTLGHGFPNDPGPTCIEEVPNTSAIIGRLKKSLRDLYKSFVDGGYGGRELRGPVCILSSPGIRHQSIDLDTMETNLCQYAKCFQCLAGTIKKYNISQMSFDFCQKYLNQLENATKKMKQQPPALCTTHCSTSSSLNDLDWEEVTKGARLTQELLTYLDKFQVSCSQEN